MKRLNRTAIASVLLGLGILVAFALAAALRQPKPAVQTKSSTQLYSPDALNDLPTTTPPPRRQRRNDVPKLGNPVGGEFGAARST